MTNDRWRDAPRLLAWTFTVLALLASVAPAWLNEEVQYDGSLAVLTLTLLAVIWYTYFTHKLTKHSEESLAFSRWLVEMQERRDRDALIVVVNRIRNYLDSLPPGNDPKVIERLRLSQDPPDDREIKELEELASRVGAKEHGLASSIVSGIRDITPYLQGAKKEDYNKDQRDRYTQALPATQKLLGDLATILKK